MKVNPLALKANFTDYTASSILFALFELDDFHSLSLEEAKDQSCPSGQKVISVAFPNNEDMNILLEEWLNRKQMLQNKEISEEEYNEWKYVWPHLCD